MLHRNLFPKGFALAAALCLAAIDGRTFAEPPVPPMPPAQQGFNNQPDVPAMPQPSILGADLRLIDFDSALRLAGVRNPELMIARERLTAAAAVRQFAAAQLLPNINAGLNYDDHTGTLQQATGAIIDVHREALYIGAGPARSAAARSPSRASPGTHNFRN